MSEIKEPLPKNDKFKDIKYEELLELFKEKRSEYLDAMNEIVARFQRKEISDEQYKDFTIEMLNEWSFVIDQHCSDEKTMREGIDLMLKVAYDKNR